MRWTWSGGACTGNGRTSKETVNILIPMIPIPPSPFVPPSSGSWRRSTSSPVNSLDPRLPGVVDHLTPRGAVPESDDVIASVEALSRRLTKGPA